MDDDNAGAGQRGENLECRPPTRDDLVSLCRELNQRGVRYIVVGGQAMIATGFLRATGDIDLLVASDAENEGKVFSALATLPDKAVRELQPGELRQFTVIRVADEILVDLMASAGGFDYDSAMQQCVVQEVDGVLIPFASPMLLWRMKAVTHRAKDAEDLLFLRQLFAEQGLEPPPP